MKKLGFVEAFARYGATLVNPQWAVSAIAPDGSIVVSCWQHKLKRSGDVLRYADTTERWSGPGRALLAEHLALAKESGRDVRLVVATASDPAAVDAGEDASKIRKTFHVRESAVGRVVEIDGARFDLEFRKASA
jgi:hypothetical protein